MEGRHALYYRRRRAPVQCENLRVDPGVEVRNRLGFSDCLGQKSDSRSWLVERSMLFSLGPVMRYELITTSRRRRYYFLRVDLWPALAAISSGRCFACGRFSIRPGARSRRSRRSRKMRSSSSPAYKGWGSCC